MCFQTIEYWGPNGMVLFRNVQFRWMPLKGRNALTIALERPGASADQGRFEDRIELQGVRRTLICRTLPRIFDGLAAGATSRWRGC